MTGTRGEIPRETPNVEHQGPVEDQNVEEATAGQTRHQPSIEQKGTGGNTAQADGQRDKGEEEG